MILLYHSRLLFMFLFILVYFSSFISFEAASCIYGFAWIEIITPPTIVSEKKQPLIVFNYLARGVNFKLSFGIQVSF